MDTICLCRLDELREGSSRGFVPWGEGRVTVFIVRRQGLHGWRNACPHWAGTPMAWRKDAYLSGDGQHIVCHAHGARFDIATGVCNLGPCLGHALTPVRLAEIDGETHLATSTTQNLLPTLHFKMGELIHAVAAVPGTRVRELVHWEPQERIEALFGRFPRLRTLAADAAGFHHDGDLTTLVRGAIEPSWNGPTT